MAKKGYTDRSAIEDYLLQAIAESFVGRLDKWIEAAEKFIDNQTGRNFLADAVASARLFDGDGSSLICIDDCVAITKVEVGQDDFGGSFEEVPAVGGGSSICYLTLPANAIVKQRPITRLRLNSKTFTPGVQNNRITAKWGFSASVPEDIALAATVIVAGILNQAMGIGGKIAQKKIGDYAVVYATDQQENDFATVKRTLSGYRRVSL